MTLMLSGSGVEWSRPLMIGWIAIALALSVIEIFWLTSQKISPSGYRHRDKS